MKTINKKAAILVIGLLPFAIFLALIDEEAKTITKNILNSSWPTKLIWIYTIIGVFVGKIFDGNGSFGFEKLTETIFSMATYGFAATTSLGLIRGVFFQLFLGRTFFVEFDKLDLSSIALVAFFLLIYSLMTIFKMLMQAIFIANAHIVTGASSP